MKSNLRVLCPIACMAFFSVPILSEATEPPKAHREVSQRAEVGFYFQHQKGSLLNEGSSDPWDPKRHEFVRIDQWSPNGWAPKDIFVVLSGPGIDLDGLRKIKQVRLAVSLKVGEFRIDPKVGITDEQRLVDSAQWWPAEFVKVVSGNKLTYRANHLALIDSIDLGRIIEVLSQVGEGLFPVEVEARVLVEPEGSTNGVPQAYAQHLRIIAGD